MGFFSIGVIAFHPIMEFFSKKGSPDIYFNHFKLSCFQIVLLEAATSSFVYCKEILTVVLERRARMIEPRTLWSALQ